MLSNNSVFSSTSKSRNYFEQNLSSYIMKTELKTPRQDISKDFLISSSSKEVSNEKN